MKKKIVNPGHADKQENSGPHLPGRDETKRLMTSPYGGIEWNRKQHCLRKFQVLQIAKSTVKNQSQHTTDRDHHLQKGHDLAAAPWMRVGIRGGGDAA